MYFNNISNETYKVLRFLQLRSNVGHILKWRRTSRLPCLTNKSPPNNFVLLIKDIFHQEFLHCLGAWLKRGWTWWAHKLYFHRKFPPPFEGRIPTDSTFGTNGVIYVWNWWSPDFWSILPIGIYRLGFEMCKLKYMIVFWINRFPLKLLKATVDGRNHEMFTISTGAGFLPSTVCLEINTYPLQRMRVNFIDDAPISISISMFESSGHFRRISY